MNTIPLEVLEASLEEGRYTSIGSYPKFMVAGNRDCLCWDCVEANASEIVRTHTEKDVKDGWYPVAIEANWEDPELYCDECGERIESAYAEPETA